jgi:hypothetical protein
MGDTLPIQTILKTYIGIFLLSIYKQPAIEIFSSLTVFGHGFKRARWRGLVKQSIQDLLIATIQNLRKLIGTIQNLPGKACNPLNRILSWSYVTLNTLFTPCPPSRLILVLI